MHTIYGNVPALTYHPFHREANIANIDWTENNNYVPYVYTQTKQVEFCHCFYHVVIGGQWSLGLTPVSWRAEILPYSNLF